MLSVSQPSWETIIQQKRQKQHKGAWGKYNTIEIRKKELPFLLPPQTAKGGGRDGMEPSNVIQEKEKERKANKMKEMLSLLPLPLEEEKKVNKGKPCR